MATDLDVFGFHLTDEEIEAISGLNGTERPMDPETFEQDKARQDEPAPGFVRIARSSARGHAGPRPGPRRGVLAAVPAVRG